ncbi:MAG: helix-turn-helix transcriptional regulator [Holophagales bacterium]|nr:MAG: helix-turn-helix transcriptional regulator [Holophagales bacterium]
MRSSTTSTKDARRLGDLLRAARIAAGLRQADLAERLGLPQSFVSKYEAGERRLTFGEVSRICSVLEVDLTELGHKLEGAGS